MIKVRRLLFISTGLLLLFISQFSSAQEGTKQLMPVGDNEQMYMWLYNIAGHTGYTNFAVYGCNESERLHIYLKEDEVMHFGMQFDDASGCKFRIKDSNDNIVYAETNVPASGKGFIDFYDEAIAGANGTILNGTEITSGYDTLNFTAKSTGNHYIEFFVPNDGTGALDGRAIMYFDVTVTDAGNNIITNADNPNNSAGRLWSKTWQFNTGGFTTPVNTEFYVFTSDEFVNKVKYQMYPYVFSFAVNSFGIDSIATNPIEQA
jgi:hypothetical protein